MVKYLQRWMPALLILSLSLGLSYYWLSHKPKAKRSTTQQVVPLVNIIQLNAIDYSTTVSAMGTIIPAQLVNLTSRINGMIISVSPNFIPGGFLKTGEKIVQLDPTDYQLIIKDKENALAKEKFDLTLELGRQAIAKREYKLLNADLDQQSQDLVLRKPHLALAKTAIAAAEAALKQARLDLQRTKTSSPFNAIVLETNAHIGSWVSTFSTGTPLIKLAGTDSFWILATLSVDKLNKIDIPDMHSNKGSEVKIYFASAWGDQVYRTGTVKRLKVELEDQGRMAELIIEISDPLSLREENQNLPTLILGAFVRLEITGRTLDKVLAIPESVIHSGQKIWLLTRQNTLDIRQIKPVWQEQGLVFIAADQLPDDSIIISTSLSAPVQGMSVHISTAIKE
ncbi:MAG TPA: HlyD family efflux transporter periplasmic adaptor subunit [Methyloprofundus sp.]|uniref:efflux RND transporter periplasmic adaptor subunit n=1 Tax=Methyloprofundus sp. TaxID=2020875 RepID=UPI0017989014|nr:HlyD family efflux transporter periplasmic adaptor subunit [Methyloprofundus sp.]HIG65693.1 HlyD family efflux transporter periplasmic adaptor subunit [Methyloprofundus sp.]HIL77468.1 HlyD family efflux transporter periplasmic adaptor subunit [Methylococcales bacterium]